MKSTTMRKGIAMIELIFAIVIMGLVLLSAPMMISTAAKSGYVALQQESIAAVSSEIGMILTHHWDEGDTNETKSAPILTTDGNTGLNAIPVGGIDTGRRAGTVAAAQARSFFTTLGGTEPASTVLGNDGDVDDIDDFISVPKTALSDIDPTTTSEGDYVDTNITLQTSVSYISDDPTNGATYFGSNDNLTFNQPFSNAAANPTSNIKMVTVTLRTTNVNTELDKEITLNAFSCNIGVYELNRRSFP